MMPPEFVADPAADAADQKVAGRGKVRGTDHQVAEAPRRTRAIEHR